MARVLKVFFGISIGFSGVILFGSLDREFVGAITAK